MLGQFARYIFISGMIILYLVNVIFLGLAAGPERTTYLGFMIMFPLFNQGAKSLDPWLTNFLIAWIEIFLAITSSVVANAVISRFMIKVGGKRFKELPAFGRP
jgi:hypothetical protein